MRGNPLIILHFFQRTKWDVGCVNLWAHSLFGVEEVTHSCMYVYVCVELLFQEDCDCGFMTPSCFDDVIIVAFWAESQYSAAISSHHYTHTVADDKGTARGRRSEKELTWTLWLFWCLLLTVIYNSLISSLVGETPDVLTHIWCCCSQFAKSQSQKTQLDLFSRLLLYQLTIIKGTGWLYCLIRVQVINMTSVQLQLCCNSDERKRDSGLRGEVE